MTRRSSPFVAAAAVIAAAIGCGESGPNLVIGNGQSFDFGSVTIGTSKENVFTLKNTGEKSLTLGTIESVNLSGAFQRTGGSCATGMSLGKNATCTMAVTFAPQVKGLAAAVIEVRYKDDKNNDKTSSLAITGTGLLDCTKDPELLTAYNIGVTDAGARNSSETASGTAAGAALTFTDGRNESYSSSYNSAYDSAYDTAYLIAYNEEYDYWRYRGQTDTYNCSQATSAGDDDGYNDGTADGRYDGYNDGYNEGYAVSYDIGYWDGYDLARWECSMSSSSEQALASKRVLGPQALAADASDIQSCYDQGYSATYNPASYWNAYQAAKAANVNYQNGYRAGITEGTSAGTTDGRNAGDAAGAADGQDDGWLVGLEEGYASCYNTAYAYAYTSGYSTGYSDYFYGYPAGYDDGDVDGYADGHYVGYGDGQQDFCGVYSVQNQALATKSSPSLFGTDQPWASTSSGLTVDTYVSRPALKVSTDAKGNKTVVKDKTIKTIRSEVASKLRKELKPKLRIKGFRKAIRINASDKLRKKPSLRTERVGFID